MKGGGNVVRLLNGWGGIRIASLCIESGYLDAKIQNIFKRDSGNLPRRGIVHMEHSVTGSCAGIYPPALVRYGVYGRLN